MYGITETTVHVTYRRISRHDIASDSGSLIGRPLADLKVYLLDHHGLPVPAGTAGEMYVGGAGLARGYLNREELTAAGSYRTPYAEGAGSTGQGTWRGRLAGRRAGVPGEGR